MTPEPNAPKPSAGLKKPVDEVLSWPKAPVPEAGKLLLKGEELVGALSFFPKGVDLLSTGEGPGDDGGETRALAIAVGLGVDSMSTSFDSSLACMLPKADCPEVKTESPPKVFALPAPLPKADISSAFAGGLNALPLLLALPKTDFVSELDCMAPKAP